MSATDQEGYPSQYEERITLKNGREVFFRPVLPSDGHLLVGFFNKISPQTRYLRFMRHLDALPDDMLYHFTHVNYDSEFALIGLIEEDGNDAIIGVARYAVDPHETTADIAVTVRDDWQHLGLGKALLAKTIDIGKEHGVFRFKSMVDPENSIIRQILLELGYEVKYSSQSGCFEVEISSKGDGERGSL